MINLSLIFLIICVAPTWSDSTDSSNSQGQNDQGQGGSGGHYVMPPKWSAFNWTATGSWQGVGTIQHQILYPFVNLDQEIDRNYIGIDVVNKQFKYNFTSGGMQKTNNSGTWLTFAPNSTCFYIPHWIYDTQILAFTKTTLKTTFSAEQALYTGLVEDVSSCATTIGVSFLTYKGRPTQWSFTGGYMVQGAPYLFDFLLTYDNIQDGVPPQSNVAYWDVDPSCYHSLSSALCSTEYPGGCSSFLATYKPTNATPSCNN